MRQNLSDEDMSVNGENVFNFKLSPKVWARIKPINKTYSNGRSIRIMTGNWTDIFQNEINKENPGCVLRFKTHHIKRPDSRKKFGPFLLATAVCKGTECTGVFKFSIENEPVAEQTVTVKFELSGSIKHSKEEVNRRNLKGETRSNVGIDIKAKTPVKVYYENIAKGNADEMEMGNYTNIPNQMVLRKIISEMVKKNISTPM